MTLNVIVGNRGFTAPVIQPDLQYQIQRYSWNVVGGPRQATIKATGGEKALWSLIDKLRCPVTVAFKEHGSEPVWWGFVEGIQIVYKDIKIGVSLREMSNRVAIAYSYLQAGTTGAGERKTTAWVEDAESSDEYGEKEILHGMGDSEDTAAEQLRDTILDLRKNPIPSIDWGGGSGGNHAIITCRGWWDTLDWAYYANSEGVEEHTTYDNNQNLGDAAGHTKVEQQFEVGTTWAGYTIQVRLRKEGTPTDNFQLGFYTDSGGSPNAELSSGSKAGADISTTADWVTITTANPIALNSGTPFHIVASRSGANDGSNYYVLSVDEGLGYADGDLQLWGGAAWGARSSDADLTFKIGGQEQTSVQMDNMITDEGEHIAVVNIEDASGVYSNQYRNGDHKAQYEIEKHMETGNSSGTRYLSEVTTNREARVYLEPTYNSSLAYLLKKDGSLSNHLNSFVHPEFCTVGVWVDTKDVIPLAGASTRLSNLSPVFIESAEYSGMSGKCRYTPRGIPEPWELIKVVEP